MIPPIQLTPVRPSKTAFLLVLMLLPLPESLGQRRSAPPLPESIKLEADVPYANSDNPRQQLNLLVPKNAKNDRRLPVIVFIHGGAWRGGDRVGGHGRLAGYVASGQYAGVSVGYRLTSEAKWPAQIHDCKAAIRWIRGNADKYNFDPNRIGVIGSSAGGHLAAMLGTSGSVDELEGTLGEHTGASSLVQCVVDEFGPSDLLAMKDYPSLMDHDAADSPEGLLVGGRVSNNRQVANAASPITYVSRDDPPFLIIHGNKDMSVPYNQSRRLAAALNDEHAECSLITVDGAGHGGFRNPEVRKLERQFFDTHLRGKDHTVGDKTIFNTQAPRQSRSAKLTPSQLGRSSQVPLVYEVEHTGVKFASPILPEVDDLPIVRPLPDPFAWSDGSGRSTEFNDWARRRSEIKAEIERYGIGQKPPRPKQITASFEDNKLQVNVTENGETLKLTARVAIPDGKGPFPAVIGIGFGSGTGSLPAEIFTERKIATIAFDFRQLMAHQQTRGKEPINRLYPSLTHIGAYSAWSWGISRIIDGLELVDEDLAIDRQHLAVTGCSFAGKMALFAGAFDERIALTIAQESGGGGAAAWRVSETLGNVETLGKTSRAWFREDMFRFSDTVEKLPYDHHELMAMVAPRALLVLGNPDFEWLADESGYVSCRAAHEVWKTFGIDDRFGFSIVGGHPHCRLPDSQRPEVEAFVDKFLLGKSDADTSITKHPFERVEHEFWYDGWTKGKSTFPTPDGQDIETFTFEAEAMTPGSDWDIKNDSDASGGQYVTVKPSLDSPGAVPPGDSSALTIPFTTTKDAKYYIHARVKCPTADDDSFWLKIDDGDYVAVNGLTTEGWQWVKLATIQHSPGKHKLTIKYRENGALLDRIGITTYRFDFAGLELLKDTRSLKDAVGPRFKIGVGVSHRVIQNADDADLIRQHFQILTPENCMKPQGIHPGEDQWNFESTDAFANFARENNLEMVGHCLVWAKDDRTDQWMMREGGTPVTQDKLLQRIQSHVETVVSRYADVVTQWDVVNEAIGDGDDGLLRDSVYSRTTGIDFLVTAFKTARLADPDALLIYNDYNGHKPDKREKLIELLTQLKAAGAPVDAYGMQGHFELGDEAIADLRETFNQLRRLDIKVVVSELDIDVVKRGRWWADDGEYRDALENYDPYIDGVPAEIDREMVRQYVELFTLFDEYSDVIERVSFWNLHDGQSWLNYFPWQRVNHPLLFDRNRQPKPAFDAVYELLTEHPSDASISAHASWPRDDANSREAHKQLIAKSKQGQIDIYFQGDSITRRWGATDYPELLAHWNKSFHGWNAANFGWGGDNTHHILWRLQNGELDDVSPKVVCLQAGANNLPWSGAADASHAEDVVEGLRAIIAEFRKRVPDVPIVLTAMFPRDQNPALAETIDAINNSLEAISEADDQIHWININADLVDSRGKLLPAVSSDGLHLEKAGYEVWSQALRPVLKRLVGEPSVSDHAPPPTGNPGL